MRPEPFYVQAAAFRVNFPADCACVYISLHIQKELQKLSGIEILTCVVPEVAFGGVSRTALGGAGGGLSTAEVAAALLLSVTSERGAPAPEAEAAGAPCCWWLYL